MNHKVTDPTVITALADIIAANRKERELNRGEKDGDHRGGNPVVAEAQAGAQASLTG